MTEDDDALDLLPSAATPWMRAGSLADADAYALAALDPELVRRAKSYALTPDHLLPDLAWERSVHEWDPAWPEWRKRNAVASSFVLHQRYGTRWALEQALDALGLGAEADEWFEYGGRPYCFRVRIPVPDGWTTVLTRTVYRVAITSKNARSYLDELLLKPAPPPAPVRVGAVAVVRRRIVASTGTYAGVPPAPATARVGTIALRRARVYARI